MAQPSLHAWTADKPLRLIQNAPDRHDPEPKAMACYGLLRTDTPGMLLRCVDGRPVSGVTTPLLGWLTARLAAAGKTALLMVWDKASWHISQEVRTWLLGHNCHVKQTGRGVRMLACRLPSKSPWLNPIEAKWVHGKRAVVEPARVLPAQEVAERVCAYDGCVHEAHLSISEKAA